MIKKHNDLDTEIYNINLKKHELYRDHENKKIDDTIFYNDLETIDLKRNNLIQQKILQLQENYKEKEYKVKEQKEIINKQVKQIKQKNSKRLGRKTIDDSYSSLIIKALMLDVVDCEEKTILAVQHWKPGINKLNLKNQIRNTISAIKNQNQQRYKKYKWDEKKYKVIKNEFI